MLLENACGSWDAGLKVERHFFRVRAIGPLMASNSKIVIIGAFIQPVKRLDSEKTEKKEEQETLVRQSSGQEKKSKAKAISHAYERVNMVDSVVRSANANFESDFGGIGKHKPVRSDA
jgi:hypothetical protein